MTLKPTPSATLAERHKVLHRSIGRLSPWRRAGKFWHQLGPGLTTGAADDDPSGIATYSQTGSRYGFQLLWLAVLTFPFMAIVQEICARIGLVSGRGLAANLRLHFPRWVLVVTTLLLFIANTFNIGADFGAMAASARLLWPGLSVILLVVVFTLLTLGLQIFTSYARYAKYLKWLALVLLAYVLTAVSLPGLHWSAIIRPAFLPSLTASKEQIILLAGVLGTTISPYLFFWQTSQEVEEEIVAGKRTVSQRQEAVHPALLKRMRVDVWSGMFFSNLVMFFIILTSGAVLHQAGITTISTASQAAEALRPLAGSATFLLFAIGIIGVGLLAVPVLAGSAAYAVSESFHWKEGLYRKLKDAYAFYGVIILATIVGLVLNFIGLDPIKALLYSAVANGLIAPVILVLLMLLASNRRVMGKHVNGPWTQTLGWGITGLMILASGAALWFLL